MTQSGQIILPPKDVPNLAEVETEQRLQLTNVDDAAHVCFGVTPGPSGRVVGRGQQPDLLIPAKGTGGHARTFSRLSDAKQPSPTRHLIHWPFRVVDSHGQSLRQRKICPPVMRLPPTPAKVARVFLLYADGWMTTDRSGVRVLRLSVPVLRSGHAQIRTVHWPPVRHRPGRYEHGDRPTL